MSKYPHLYEFNQTGLDLFRKIMQDQLDEAALDPIDKRYAKPLSETGPFQVGQFQTAREMAVAICKSFGDADPQKYAAREGVWAWLYFALLDVVSPRVAGGKRKVLEFVRWYPGDPNDYQKAQRHLVRMPTLLYSGLGSSADHLLCGKPHTGPEIREQLTSQQDMFSVNFQQACRALYFDDKTGALKKGVAGQDTPGSTRRLAQVRKQLDVTWDMTDLSPVKILELLPAEFDRFKT